MNHSVSYVFHGLSKSPHPITTHNAEREMNQVGSSPACNLAEPRFLGAGETYFFEIITLIVST